MTQIAWVLGAGFSAPLGAPMLNGLFTPEAFGDLRAVYAEHPVAAENVCGALAIYARRLFLFGTGFERGVITERDKWLARDRSAERRWSDAEAFLDELEGAALDEQGPTAKRLGTILALLRDEKDNPGVPPTVAAVRDAARRMLALETSRFLLGATPEKVKNSERWLPYRTWRDDLKNNVGNDNRHTIISFNYDSVLERLGLTDGVVMPLRGHGDPNDPALPKIFKLHGSVDWKRTRAATLERTGDEHFPATCKSEELAIAPPGPEKEEITKAFGEYWTAALIALQQAQVVVFMGYRFPPTDARSRQKLLGALHPKAHLHIMLGPDVNHPHVVRLGALLRTNSPGAHIYTHPLYCEDFMTAWRLQKLNDWETWAPLSRWGGPR